MSHDHQPTASANAVDPVCGMTVAADSAAASREVGRATYYFCSNHCAATFDADPDRYTSAAADK
jgi:Cu+-exporting ATPase